MKDVLLPCFKREHLSFPQPPGTVQFGHPTGTQEVSVQSAARREPRRLTAPPPTPPGDVVPQETQLGSRSPGTTLVLGTVRVSHGCFPGSGSEKRLPFFMLGCPSGFSHSYRPLGLGGALP